MTAFGFADEGLETMPPSSSSVQASAAAAAATVQPSSSSSSVLIPPSTLDSHPSVQPNSTALTGAHPSVQPNSTALTGAHPSVQPNSTALTGASLEDDAAKLIVQHEIFVKATVRCALSFPMHAWVRLTWRLAGSKELGKSVARR
jgi:hypothetical protein